jgi:glutamyl-tRNA synthetase
MESPVRTRFCLVPNGPPQIDAARIALFNSLLARGAGGRFLIRIDDLERATAGGDAVQGILADLRWLGLEWDEGPEVGGPHGPYVQSQRLHIYERYYTQLIATGMAYHTFDAPEELDRMRREALAQGRPFRYPRPRRLPAPEEARRAGEEGRPVVLRFKMPGGDLTVEDLVLGPVTIHAEEFEDFVIRGADGRPTWLFATVIDDELMKVTHVIRGQEYLPHTHRHVALQEALGFGRPAYGHVPLMVDADGGRPKGACVRDFRAAGYLPEVVASYLSSLGMREAKPSDPGGEVRSFEVERISRTTARFDRKALLSLNWQAVADAEEDRLLAGLRDYVAINDTPLAAADEAALRRLLRLAVGFRVFRDIDEKCRALFVADEQVVYDEAAVRKVLARGDPRGFDVLAMVQGPLGGLASWDAGHVAGVIREVGERTGLAAARVAQPLRVAVAGAASNLPIGPLLEVLGRDRTLRRIWRCLAVCGADRKDLY